MKIYNVGIPSSLIGLSLYLGAVWSTLQFLFCSIDDFVDWKRNFLIDESVRPKDRLGERTVLIEIHSFSKGKIIYNPIFGTSFQGNIPKIPDLNEAKMGLESDMKQFEI